MSGQKSNKVFCTCSKCCKKDIEGKGLLISKSTRTRHRKQENEKPPASDSTLSSTTSGLSFTDVYFSSESFESESSINSICAIVNIPDRNIIMYVLL